MALLLTSGVLTALYAGLNKQFATNWMRAFIHAWPIAFPAILLIAPLVRKILVSITD